EEDPPEGTRAGIDHLSDLTQDSLDHFDCAALSEYEGTYLGDNSQMTNFFRAMPTGEDMEKFRIDGALGHLMVNYAAIANEDLPPNSVLHDGLRAIAACGFQNVQNLNAVSFLLNRDGKPQSITVNR
ncbi:MAG: hypothetical protein Q4G64_10005, partial [bacterium]|nr:hypothetical protein [bacterium]